MSIEPLCVDLRTAAAAIGVSVWVLRRWIDEGRIPTVRFPSVKHEGEPSRRVLIASKDLRAFVKRHRVGGQ